MKHVDPRKALSIAIVAASLSQVPVASAQQQLGLEEVIVTAQRRSESLQEVPVSVTALSSDALGSYGLEDLNQIWLAAPSLQLNQDNTYSIRGIGTLAFAGTLDSSVALSLDDVNLGRSFLSGAILNDVSQIEVLHGPQGLLYGKNASAGLLNIRTNLPEIGVLSGNANAEYQERSSTPNNGSSVITKGTLNVPIGDISAMRINGQYAEQDPVAVAKEVVGDNQFDEKSKNYGGRVKYLIEPSDQLSVYLLGYYNKEKGVGGIFDRTYRNVPPESPKAAVLEAEGITPGPKNLYYGVSGGSYRDIESSGLQGKVSYELANGYQLSNIAAWKGFDRKQNLDTDFTTTNELDTNYTKENYDQYSNELRLEIPATERLNGQVGLYYFELETKQDRQLAGDGGVPSFVLPGFPFCVGATVTPGPPPNCSVSNDYFLGNDSTYKLNNRSMAVFSQFDYDLTDVLKLIAGGRYTYDEIKLDMTQGQLNYFVPFGVNTTVDENDDHDNFSWKLGTQYQFTDDLMGYFTVATGYKGPGYNDTAATEDSDLYVKPETVYSYELGIKSTWFDNRLIVNADVFYQEFDDYQVQAFDSSLQTFITQNAASMTSQGAELSVSALPLEGLTVTAALTYLDSSFDDFKGAECYPGQPDCGMDGTFNAGGLDTPQAPDLTTTLQATYDFTITSGVEGFVSANWYYRSSTNFQISQGPETGLGSVDIIGASVGAVIDNDWRISAFCRNCSDEYVPSFISYDAGDAIEGVPTTVQAWGWNSVRNVGLSIDYTF